MTHPNLLVAALSRRDRSRLLAIGRIVRLVAGEVLYERGEDATSVYFPTAGSVLMSVPTHTSSGLGVLLVGREGMLGTHRILGSSRSPLRAVAQASGHALRMDATTFGETLTSSATLKRSMVDYVGIMIQQLSVAAVCARFQAITPRLAGWFLKIRDRRSAERFHVTQESLALMLGVRRSSITVAAQEMQRLGLIDYKRGHVIVLNVPGLQALAGDCYCVDRTVRAASLRAKGQATSSPSSTSLTKVVDPLHPLGTGRCNGEFSGGVISAAYGDRAGSTGPNLL